MMKREPRKIAVWTLAAALGAAAIVPGYASAASTTAAVSAAKANFAAADVQVDAAVEQAMKQLAQQGVMQGYENGALRPNQPLTQAEAAKLLVLALDLEAGGQDALSGQAEHQGKWYVSYVNTAIAHGLFDATAAAKFQPNKPVTEPELAAMVAKGLERDTLSVRHWLSGAADGKGNATRGETARLLVTAEQSVRSAEAKIVSVKALDGIALEVTMSGPMTLADETIEKSAETFKFDGGVTIVNQPRLKTGSVNAYIVPVTKLEEGKSYTLTYKGEQTISFKGNGELIRFNSASQVTNDTFEVEALLSEGVVDYGYVISAYAGGRGADALVLEEGNTYQGKPLQIISSLRNRTAVLTPEGGQPINVSYVGYTQSTDGKQEPKFRLPAGTKLEAGVKYTVSANWFQVANASFVAKDIAPLTIVSAQQTDAKTLTVTLAQDPMDELFAFRSVTLKGADGSTLTAQYRVQTRKGAVGIFDVMNGGELKSGVTYTVTPVGTWAVNAGEVTLAAK
ncbi:S-layer domain protein [Paenibacillus curdlanolyticus YK9]|uniref:S-layer domain protein n=1 Tax=Paenibacillus curdlanolyticus YK9 TaxID=717606 RepID=E0IAF1_9BACL|nr:S-layer homology domain-containing protein [Paenibacillus curdlanolyticus]EFM10728.1 S-layer domain protein [Paenibacillus curdlanolyticus YK9]